MIDGIAWSPSISRTAAPCILSSFASLRGKGCNITPASRREASGTVWQLRKVPGAAAHFFSTDIAEPCHAKKVYLCTPLTEAT